MARANIKTAFSCDIKKVWETVTSLKVYSWRSDLSKIEILSKNKFTEYTKNGYTTTFTTTVMEPYKRWEFDMENENLYGHWIGLFSQKGDKTIIDFTEDVTAKKCLMKPFVGMYLKKQQASYIQDLKRELEN